MSAFHGGVDPYTLAASGVDPENVKDFSVSINPASLPLDIQDIIRQSAISRYPDSRSRALVDTLSARYTTPKETAMVVNGTSQAIHLIARAFLDSESSTLIAGPTFGEYRDACSLSGARILEHRSTEASEFHPDLDSLADAIQQERPAVFWICSPNNPTGALLSLDESRRLAEVCIESGTLMVLDEAYRCFTPPEKTSDEFLPGAIHLRSMTKDFCIPGLRLGWVRGEERSIAILEKHQPDWSVSAPAQDAGKACLDRLDYFEASWAETRRLKQIFAADVVEAGYQVFPSDSNFFLVRIGDDGDVKRLAEFLWQDLIQIRDCASFGLEGIIRLGTRSAQDNRELVERLKVFPR